MSDPRDPFAPSTDPDIPTPTREDLLRHVHGSVRDHLAAGALDAAHAQNEWTGARRIWDETHKAEAMRRPEDEREREEVFPLTETTIQPETHDHAAPYNSVPEVENIELRIGGESSDSANISLALEDKQPGGMPRDKDSPPMDFLPVVDTPGTFGVGIEPTEQSAEPIYVRTWKDRLVDWLVRTKTPRQEGETFLGKFDRLSESNLFWGGGVGIVSLGLGFRFAGAPRWFSIVLLIVGWLIISVSIWRHEFFDIYGRLIQIAANTFICAAVAVLISGAWRALVPASQQPPQKDQTVKVVPQPAIVPDASPQLSATFSPTTSPSPSPLRSVAMSPLPRNIETKSEPQPAQPRPTASSESPAPHISQVSAVFPSVREGLPYGFCITLQTTVVISPVQVLVQCSGPIEEATNIVIGASTKLGSGAAPRGKDYYSFRIDAPPFTPQSPIQIDVFSKTKVTCKVVRVD